MKFTSASKSLNFTVGFMSETWKTCMILCRTTESFMFVLFAVSEINGLVELWRLVLVNYFGEYSHFLQPHRGKCCVHFKNGEKLGLLRDVVSRQNWHFGLLLQLLLGSKPCIFGPQFILFCFILFFWHK